MTGLPLIDWDWHAKIEKTNSQALVLLNERDKREVEEEKRKAERLQDASRRPNGS